MAQTKNETARPALHVIDGCSRRRAAFARAGMNAGYHVEVYASLTELLARPPQAGIVFLHDAQSDGGIAALGTGLGAHGIWLPAVVYAQEVEPARIVSAIRGGAVDYLAYPISSERLVTVVAEAEAEAVRLGEARRKLLTARRRLMDLSEREREVLEWLAAGCSNKGIARELRISPRTVEIHRSKMLAKLGAAHSAEAVRLRLEADLLPSLVMV
ncbi:response regulator transcription factor [Qipengyuania atrilutea]|uniref:Helix-turn-helix transcriptional regulator n=1 Tax=Qipengyuania atrilutea TaxID=2744473 RepID=A0A850GVP2_9SPHN|nr:LuxR C-terminal-related transcriptional regulator [Actirhodobacter atriluteus]NVD43571.1 helix-turn-helix transcriptional regulator [Actirhodobacter atriluteus]